MSDQTVEEIVQAAFGEQQETRGKYLLYRARLRREEFPLFFNPPKYLAARYIAERQTWQLFSGAAVILEHEHQGQVLLYLLHFGYEEVVPGFYVREVPDAA